MLGQEIGATAIAHEKSFSEKYKCIGSNILQQNEVSVTKGLVFGNEKLEKDQKKIFICGYKLSYTTERFQVPQLQ